MRNAATALFLIASTLFTVGCTRTYLSTGQGGVVSPDGKTHLCLTSHGAYGRSYIDKTRKLLDVWIWTGSGTNETMLFKHRYKFVGSDMSEHVQWNSPEEVLVYVYDYGPGVSSHEAETNHAPSNYIATLSFYLDKQIGKFAQKK